MAMTLEERITQLEDRAAIKELIANYCFYIDNRDLKTAQDLFTETGRLRSLDGSMNAVGRAAIVTTYEGRFKVLGPTYHVTHDSVVRFESPTRARGWVASHAEVWRKNEPQWAALRYEDIYEKGSDGKWRFAERVLQFYYYLNWDEYPKYLGSLQRNRSQEVPKDADWPEKLPTWNDIRDNKS